MASSPLPSLFLVTLLVVINLNLIPSQVQAQVDETSLKLMTDALEWPTTTMSLYDEFGDGSYEEDEDIDGGGLGLAGRRSLFWRGFRYYISYGALSANRIPCPPRSGRSYYTHNCFNARGPVHPYTRGCSRITLCRI